MEYIKRTADTLFTGCKTIDHILLAIIPMRDGFLGEESALELLQSKAEHVEHSYSEGLRVPIPLCDKGDVL